MASFLTGKFRFPNATMESGQGVDSTPRPTAGIELWFAALCWTIGPQGLAGRVGDHAYSEARRREREASSNEIAKDWDRIALAVARKTGNRVGLDTATRMSMDADFSLREDQAAAIERPPHANTDPIEELARIVAESRCAPSFGFSFWASRLSATRRS